MVFCCTHRLLPSPLVIREDSFSSLWHQVQKSPSNIGLKKRRGRMVVTRGVKEKRRTQPIEATTGLIEDYRD